MYLLFAQKEQDANSTTHTVIRYMFGNCLQDEVAVRMVDSHSKKNRVVQSPAIFLIT